jgi:hypothetical protein
MEQDSTPERDEEIDSFLNRSRSLLDSVFTSLYRLGQEEAVEVAGKLHGWFHQFAERPGIEEIPVEALEEMLLVGACRYARETQLEKQGGAFLWDSDLDRVLARPPERVAIGVLVELAKRRRHER